MDIKEININEIMDLIPHRPPFLFVDRVINFKKGVSATGIKNVTINDNFFGGHFPGNPVMPGVLMIEALAQTSGVLVAKSLNAKPGEKTVLFTTINNVRFRKPVLPGDTLLLDVEIVKSKMDIWVIRGEARVGDAKVMEAEFSALILDQK